MSHNEHTFDQSPPTSNAQWCCIKCKIWRDEETVRAPCGTEKLASSNRKDAKLFVEKIGAMFCEQRLWTVHSMKAIQNVQTWSSHDNAAIRCFITATHGGVKSFTSMFRLTDLQHLPPILFLTPHPTLSDDPIPISVSATFPLLPPQLCKSSPFPQVLSTPSSSHPLPPSPRHSRLARLARDHIRPLQLIPCSL